MGPGEAGLRRSAHEGEHSHLHVVSICHRNAPPLVPSGNYWLWSASCGDSRAASRVQVLGGGRADVSLVTYPTHLLRRESCELHNVFQSDGLAPADHVDAPHVAAAESALARVRSPEFEALRDQAPPV
jgi:hypothetical protein